MTRIRCVELLDDTKWMLAKSGLWPIRRITICEVLKFIFSFLADAFLFIFASYNTVIAIKTGDIDLINLMICVLIPAANYTAKGYTIIMNKRCLEDILADLESDAFNTHSLQLNKYLQLIHNTTKTFLKYFILTLTLYMSVRSILPMIVNVEMIVPAPVDMGNFDILYKIAHLFATASASFNTVAFDVLYLSLMSLCIAQLNILQEKLKGIFETVEESRRETENISRLVLRIVKECVILHETINQYVQKINVLLSFPLFVQYTCGCFILCTIVLQLKLSGPSDTANILGICLFFSVTFGQMAAYHYLGNEILFKSDKIIEATYCSKWYILEIQSQKGLLFLMERAKRPLIIEVYKYFAISLDSLGVIFRWAYSVFAVMRAGFN